MILMIAAMWQHQNSTSVRDFTVIMPKVKKAINFLIDSMFYSWHLFGLGHGKAHTELVPRCHHMEKMAISM